MFTEHWLCFAGVREVESVAVILVAHPRSWRWLRCAEQVGVVHEYRMSQGRMVLHYMNLSPEAITQFSVEITQVTFVATNLALSRVKYEGVFVGIGRGRHVPLPAAPVEVHGC